MGNKAQCDIDINVIAGVFSQEQLTFFILYPELTADLRITMYVLDVHIFAGIWQIRHLKSILHVTLCYMYCEIRYTRAVPRRMLNLHCANAESLCFVIWHGLVTA